MGSNCWNSADIVGYTYNADTYCTNCKPEVKLDTYGDPDPHYGDINVIIVDSEWDDQPSCCECGELIQPVTILQNKEGN